MTDRAGRPSLPSLPGRAAPEAGLRSESRLLRLALRRVQAAAASVRAAQRTLRHRNERAISLSKLKLLAPQQLMANSV